MISNIDFIQNPGTIPSVLSPEAAQISQDSLVNELSLNTAYKSAWSLVSLLPIPK